MSAAIKLLLYSFISEKNLERNVLELAFCLFAMIQIVLIDFRLHI